MELYEKKVPDYENCMISFFCSTRAIVFVILTNKNLGHNYQVLAKLYQCEPLIKSLKTKFKNGIIFKVLYK